MTTPTVRRATLCLSTCLLACGPADDAMSGANEDTAGLDACGPTHAIVTRVIDGDTIEIDGGERVRYLMIDTPETSGTPECWGEEAKAANISFVEGREIELSYDQECRDTYDRLLAYIWVDGVNINELMIQRGHACVLHIPPNGADYLDDFTALEDEAKNASKGLWASCESSPC